MSTLEELLAGDGFEREADRSKPPPARTISNVDRRRSLHTMPENGGFTEPRSINALARRFSCVNFYKEHLPKVEKRDSRVLRCSKETEGGSGKNRRRLFSIEKPDANCKSGRVIGPKDGRFEDFQRKLGYSRSYSNELYEDEERKGKDVGNRFPVLPLNETTLKPVFLMINSCIIDLIEDESLRSLVNRRCLNSLNSCGMKDTQLSGNGVVSTLKEAIGSVEKIVREGFTKLELKKTSIKLSVITGLKAMESEDVYFCGISLSHLAACAHLYLSILYKIQKKNTVSAKHLLQFFFHSPYQARTALLPELWESLFLPHLVHLKAWYDREVESIQGKFGLERKLEILTKLYNDLLDMGTSKFAAFYKGWLMEDYKSPALPSLHIPFTSFPELSEVDCEIISAKSLSASYSVPSEAMASKMPYESAFTERKRIQTSDGMESWGKGKAEMEDVIEESQLDVWKQCQTTKRKDEEIGHQFGYLGLYSSEISQEYYTAGSNDLDSSFEVSDIDENQSRKELKRDSSSPASTEMKGGGRR